ncbi:MAG TPA: hypothetical protein EYH35_02170, partial [Thiotrichaceae bacterium]|nr:hypothetical protein [Thiotrichaceae bacterium]
MKNRTALSLAISLVMACPTALQALGLGELHSSSQLNQPLRAKIDLLSTSASQANKLKVRLASADVFRRVGIDRPAYLDNLRFTPTVSNGKPIIRVTSNTPISEPFLNFLLEVSWPQGQLLKEYTVLLDPPVLLQSGNVTADNSASVRAEPRPATRANQRQVAEQQRLEQQRQQQIRIQQQQRQRQQQAVTVEQRRARAQQELFEAQARSVLNERTSIASTTTVRKRATPTHSRSKYRVRRGDTMLKVATKLRYRGVSTSQMMIALFRANPHAFSNGNVNNLKSGVLLSRPSKNSVNQITSNESKQLILQHFAQWKKYRSGVANNTVAQKNIKASSRRSEPVQPKRSTDNNDQASLKVAGRTGAKPIDQAAEQQATGALQQKVFLAQEALASSRSENAELTSRVSRLEAIIRKKDRLINLKNDRLAKLQLQLSGASQVTEPEDLVNQVANEADQASNRIIRTEEEPSGNIANDLAKNTLKTEPEKVSSPFLNEEEKSGEGILGFLSSPLVASIGGGSLLALLFGWLLMRRSRNSIQDVGASIDDEFFNDELDNDSHDNQLDNYIDDADHKTIVDDSFED